jgi:hypothetical protein
MIPLMLPNLTYKVDLTIENIDVTGANDVIKVFVIDASGNQQATVPMITANIQMPVSEINIE